jgi:hypothetical protein
VLSGEVEFYNDTPVLFRRTKHRRKPIAVPKDYPLPIRERVKLPATKATAKPTAKRITAKDIIDPVLGGAEARLQASVEEAIRLYGGGRKKR